MAGTPVSFAVTAAAQAMWLVLQR